MVGETAFADNVSKAPGRIYSMEHTFGHEYGAKLIGFRQPHLRPSVQWYDRVDIKELRHSVPFAVPTAQMSSVCLLPATLIALPPEMSGRWSIQWCKLEAGEYRIPGLNRPGPFQMIETKQCPALGLHQCPVMPIDCFVFDLGSCEEASGRELFLDGPNFDE